ncbi:MAG: ATP-binding protein [Rhodothermales bacterium]
MNREEHEAESGLSPWFSLSRSAFWKVAGILIGIQIATGLLAVVLSAWFAYDRSLDLVEQTIRVKIDDLATEIERRAFPPGIAPEKVFSLADLPSSLVLDLSTRFPDPITLLDENGQVIRTIQPDASEFDRDLKPGPLVVNTPEDIGAQLLRDRVSIYTDSDEIEGETTYGLAPIYNGGGDIIGGVLIQPLTNSIDQEIVGTYKAFYDAVRYVIAISLFTALFIGGFFTWRIVKPLRDMMQQVESIGAGDYSVRVNTSSEDELGRLANAINLMAEDVEHSMEALRETDKLRRQMIANFGHDLRTPLAALLGYLEETNRYLEGGHRESALESVTTAERQGKYLQKLIGDLFELSLLDSAQAPLRKEPIPLAELLTDAANTHRQVMSKDDISFELSLPSSLPMIEGDGVRLLRVLDNLMSNARNHTPAGGTVTLHSEVTETGILIAVQDTGCGISTEDLGHVFDRYYSGSGPRTRRKRGTGLGLPISWAIARAHGGSLIAESELGVGSSFILQLPFSVKEPVPVV